MASGARTLRPPSSSSGVSKTFRSRTSACTRSRSARCIRCAAAALDRFDALQDVSFAVEHGRVLRHRRPQRLGQEHAAEVPGRDLPRSTRARSGGRAPVDVHRARRRLQPRSRRARQRRCSTGSCSASRPREAGARYEQVIEFAELEEFQDLKLKNYSSGMHVRLAFSVMIQVDADILLIDEVLAVGDAAFQQKCFDVFHRMRDEGKTIVFVTHDMGAVERFCHRAMLLERGGRAHRRPPREVAARYLELNFGRELERPTTDSRACRPAPATATAARILEAWFEDEPASADRRPPRASPARFRVACASTRRRATRRSPSSSRTSATDHFVAIDRGRARSGRGASRRVRRSSSPCPSRTSSRPGATTSPRDAPRRRRRPHRPLRARRVGRHRGHARAGGLVDLPHEMRVGACGRRDRRVGRGPP